MHTVEALEQKKPRFRSVNSAPHDIHRTEGFCHGPCSITFFPKNNQRTAPTESPMMSASPLFSATITTSHLRRTYIRAPSEYSSTPLPPKQPAFLSLSLPTNTMCLLPQHNHSPTMLHTRSMFQANHIAHAPVSRS